MTEVQANRSFVQISLMLLGFSNDFRTLPRKIQKEIPYEIVSDADERKNADASLAKQKLKLQTSVNVIIYLRSHINSRKIGRPVGSRHMSCARCIRPTPTGPDGTCPGNGLSCGLMSPTPVQPALCRLDRL